MRFAVFGAAWSHAAVWPPTPPPGQMPDSVSDLSQVTDYPLTNALTMAGAIFVLGLELVRRVLSSRLRSSNARVSRVCSPAHPVWFPPLNRCCITPVSTCTAMRRRLRRRR